MQKGFGDCLLPWRPLCTSSRARSARRALVKWMLKKQCAEETACLCAALRWIIFSSPAVSGARAPCAGKRRLGFNPQQVLRRYFSGARKKKQQQHALTLARCLSLFLVAGVMDSNACMLLIKSRACLHLHLDLLYRRR